MDEISDRNLLFGILAVQLDYVRAPQFMEAANQWMLNKNIAVGEILVAKGFLSDEDRWFLNAIVDKHISRSGSPQKSLECFQASAAELSDLTKSNEFLTNVNAATSQLESYGELTVELTAAGDLSIIGQRFSLIRKLARGGLGEVFVARDRELDREVALKRIIDERRSVRDVNDRFLAEAKITGGLEHPGIVPVYGLGAFPNGAPFYVMRLIRGQSLHDAIYSLHKEKGKPKDKTDEDRTLRNLIRAVIDACYAVAYANSRGVIHRDLKPQNIMLGKYGETLVVDWGLAKVKGVEDTAYMRSEPPIDDPKLSDSAPTAIGSILGTYAFMSPEQANGRIDLIDRRSDVFSLGATLYATLTGRAPFKEENRRETLASAKACEFPLPRELNPSVSKSLEAICLKALAKEREDRYDNAAELAEDLDNWIAGATVKAYPEPLLQRTLRFTRKHQTAVASVLVSLCVASIALLLSNFAVGRQRNIAQKNSEVSTVILEQFVKNIVGEKWAGIPNMDEERLAMYELALKRFKDLLKASPDDQDLKKNVCQLYVRSADVYRHRGNDSEANSRSEAAYQLAEELLTSSHEDINFLHLIADCSRNLAQNRLLNLGAAKALPFSEKSKQVSVKRAQLDNRPSAQLSLALASLQHSEICREVGDPKTALAEATAAQAIFEQMMPSKTRPFIQPIYHASSLIAKAAAYSDLGQLEDALKTALESYEITLKSQSEFKDIIDIKTVHAESNLALSNIERLSKAYPSATQYAENALNTIEQMCTVSPSNVNYRRLKAEALQSLSFIALNRNDKPAALEAAAKSQAALDTVFVDQPMNLQIIPIQLLTHAAMYAALDGVSQPETRAQLKSHIVRSQQELQSANPTHPALKRVEQLLSD